MEYCPFSIKQYTYTRTITLSYYRTNGDKHRLYICPFYIRLYWLTINSSICLNMFIVHT